MKRIEKLALIVACCAPRLCLAGGGGLDANWIAQFGGPNNRMDQFIDMTVDNAGRVFVTGTAGPGQETDIVTVAYDADGAQLWVAEFDGPAAGQDVTQAIAVDNQGGVFVVGRSSTPSSSSDWITLKYDATSGAELWARLHDGPVHSLDEAHAVTTDSHGNIFVTGAVTTNNDGNDIETVMYDADGNELWASGYSGLGDMPFADDRGSAIAVDPSGDVVVTGFSANFNGVSDYATIKYRASDGEELWVSRYDGIGMTDTPFDLAIDETGDVYVVGISKQTQETVATVAYRGSDGAELWEMVHDPGTHEHSPRIDVGGGAVFVSAVVDPDGDQSNNNNNAFTASYVAATGGLIWEASYGENGNGDHDAAYDLGRDGAGNLFVVGRTNSYGADADLLVLRYEETTGAELSQTTYSGAGVFDSGASVKIAPNGDVIVSGITSNPAGDQDYLVINFDGFVTTSIADLSDCSITFGSTDNGPCDIANLLDDDDVDQILRSQFGFSAFERNLTEIVINGDGLGATTMVSIDTRDGSDTTNVVAKVKARNYTSNSIDDIAQYSVSFPSDDTSHSTLVNSADYVDANGDVEIRLRYVAPATFTPLGFTVGLDQVRVMVQ